MYSAYVEDYFNTELPLEEGAFLVGLAAGFVDNCEGAGIPEGKLTERIRKLFNRIEVDSDEALDARGRRGGVSLKGRSGRGGCCRRCDVNSRGGVQ